MSSNLISRGGHAIYAWGSVRNGRIPIGRARGSTKPVRINVPPQFRYVKVSSHTAHGLALTECGKVFSWGSNRFGQLGDGSTLDALDPQLVEALTCVKIVDISTGPTHSAAVDSNGGVWVWGASSAINGEAPWLGRPTSSFPLGRGTTLRDPAKPLSSLSSLTSAFNSLSLFRRPLVVPRRLASFGAASAGAVFPDFLSEPMSGTNAPPPPSSTTPSPSPGGAADAKAAAGADAPQTNADGSGADDAVEQKKREKAAAKAAKARETAAAAEAERVATLVDDVVEATIDQFELPIMGAVVDDADAPGSGGGAAAIVPVWTASYVAERLEAAAEEEVCSEAWLGVGPLPMMSKRLVWPKRRKQLLSDDWEVRDKALRLSGPAVRAWLKAAETVPGAVEERGGSGSGWRAPKAKKEKKGKSENVGKGEEGEGEKQNAEEGEGEEGEEEDDGDVDELGGQMEKWEDEALHALKSLVRRRVEARVRAGEARVGDANGVKGASGGGGASSTTASKDSATDREGPAAVEEGGASKGAGGEDGGVSGYAFDPLEMILTSPEAIAASEGGSTSRTARVRAAARAAAKANIARDEIRAAASALGEDADEFVAAHEGVAGSGGVGGAANARARAATEKSAASRAAAAEALKSGGFLRWAKTQQRVVWLARWKMDAGNALLSEEALNGKDELDFALREAAGDEDEDGEEDGEGAVAQKTGGVVADEPPLAPAVAPSHGLFAGDTDPDASAPKAVKVACGDQMTAVVTEDGCVYTFGAWKAFRHPFSSFSGSVGVLRRTAKRPDGRLGTLPPRENLDVPERVPLAKRHEVDSVAIGHTHTMFVSSRGYMFGSGRNTAGQLGRVAGRASILPRVIPSLSAGGRAMQQTVHVAARGASTAAVAADGGVVVSGELGRLYTPFGSVYDGLRKQGADLSRKFASVSISPGSGSGNGLFPMNLWGPRFFLGTGANGREQHAVLVNDVGQLVTVGSDVSGQTSAQGGSLGRWLVGRGLPVAFVSPLSVLGAACGRIAARVVEDVELYVHRNRPPEDDEEGSRRKAKKKQAAEDEEGDEGAEEEGGEKKGKDAEEEGEVEEVEPEAEEEDEKPKTTLHSSDGSLDGTRTLLNVVAAMQTTASGVMGQTLGIFLPSHVTGKTPLELAQLHGLPVEVVQAVSPHRVAIARAALGLYSMLTSNGSRSPQMTRHTWLQQRNLRVVSAEAGDGTTFAVVAPADAWHFEKHLKLLMPPEPKPEGEGEGEDGAVEEKAKGGKKSEEKGEGVEKDADKKGQPAAAE